MRGCSPTKPACQRPDRLPRGRAGRSTRRRPRLVGSGTQGGQGMTRLAIYGAGAFGSALAMTYAAAGLQVTLWARAGADRIAETRETPRLPGQRLPDSVRVTSDPRIDADIALIAVPTQSLDAMLARRSSPRAGPRLLRQGHRHDDRPRSHGTGAAPRARGAGGAADRTELSPWTSRRGCRRR
jgi:hypothetical protein